MNITSNGSETFGRGTGRKRSVVFML
uniref:Uncharacterized protein n=1 Tax=Anguilla anguilla TaxID=7936 RepID=A0A0E9RXF1_ANGAN